MTRPRLAARFAAFRPLTDSPGSAGRWQTRRIAFWGFRDDFDGEKARAAAWRAFERAFGENDGSWALDKMGSADEIA